MSLDRRRLLMKPAYKLLTQADFQNGTFGGVAGHNWHTLLSNQQDGSDGFTVTGMALNYSADAYTIANTMPHWICNEDLSQYKKISFYAKKAVNYGRIRVFIFNGTTLKLLFLNLSYGASPTTYTKYETELNCVEGDRIYFIGGYHDNSGGDQSATSYCNIILYR